jgi:hypothetical protein
MTASHNAFALHLVTRVSIKMVVLNILWNSRTLGTTIRRKLPLTQYREGKWSGCGHCSWSAGPQARVMVTWASSTAIGKEQQNMCFSVSSFFGFWSLTSQLFHYFTYRLQCKYSLLCLRSKHQVEKLPDWKEAQHPWDARVSRVWWGSCLSLLSHALGRYISAAGLELSDKGQN